jgi:hypothetical protein
LSRPAAEALEVLRRAGYEQSGIAGKYGNRVLLVYREGKEVAKLPVRSGCVDRYEVARLVREIDQPMHRLSRKPNAEEADYLRQAGWKVD